MSEGALQKIYFSAPGVFCSAGKNIGELWACVCAADNSGIKKNKDSFWKGIFCGPGRRPVFAQCECPT